MTTVRPHQLKYVGYEIQDDLHSWECLVCDIYVFLRFGDPVICPNFEKQLKQINHSPLVCVNDDNRWLCCGCNAEFLAQPNGKVVCPHDETKKENEVIKSNTEAKLLFVQGRMQEANLMLGDLERKSVPRIIRELETNLKSYLEDEARLKDQLAQKKKESEVKKQDKDREEQESKLRAHLSGRREALVELLQDPKFNRTMGKVEVVRRHIHAVEDEWSKVGNPDDGVPGPETWRPLTDSSVKFAGNFTDSLGRQWTLSATEEENGSMTVSYTCDQNSRND